MVAVVAVGKLEGVFAQKTASNLLCEGSIVSASFSCLLEENETDSVWYLFICLLE